MTYDPLYVLFFLCLLVALCEWLVRISFLKHFGTALLVILFTAIVANLGILPAGSTPERPVPVYDGIFAYLAPISIFWLLLRVNLRDILKAGLPLVVLFVIGSLGTTLGIILGMAAVNAPETIGPSFAALGGMFVGTYTGGSVNFNAIALNYDVVRDGVLYGGSVVADNILTTVWMIVTLSAPMFLKPLWPRKQENSSVATQGPDLGINVDTEALHPLDLGIVLALGAGALAVSNWLAGILGIPMIIVITLLALIIAQLPLAKKLRGGQVLGMFAVYLFLAVIGAFCDLQALRELGSLGLVILGFATVGVLVHGLVIFGAARIMKLDLDLASVASQANVGGGTSALALARSRGRTDLVLPAVLLGSLGNAIGTFLGFWASEQLLPFFLG